jgi:hypothetical protein
MKMTEKEIKKALFTKIESALDNDVPYDEIVDMLDALILKATKKRHQKSSKKA